ncbi:hypothetical protein C8J56DRAFT_896291 [Mycena floridula]|nr:hypothetical protein C8J56DRAFT_896291 [Mycena floridula]
MNIQLSGLYIDRPQSELGKMNSHPGANFLFGAVVVKISQLQTGRSSPNIQMRLPATLLALLQAQNDTPSSSSTTQPTLIPAPEPTPPVINDSSLLRIQLLRSHHTTRREFSPSVIPGPLTTTVLNDEVVFHSSLFNIKDAFSEKMGLRYDVEVPVTTTVHTFHHYLSGAMSNGPLEYSFMEQDAPDLHLEPMEFVKSASSTGGISHLHVIPFKIQPTVNGE